MLLGGIDRRRAAYLQSRPTPRRSFLGGLAALPTGGRVGRPGSAPPPGIEVRPSALYQQPDGRRNLVRITVAGLDSPAARARVTDRRGALVGTAGLLPSPGEGGGGGGGGGGGATQREGGGGRSRG